MLVEGEPGIGKTRLLDATATYARSEGFEVLLGTCDDLAAPRPFAALLAALGVTPAATDRDRVEVAALLETHEATLGATEGAANPGVQYRVIEALGALVEREAAQRPVVLALDDLQWADVSTLVALRSIARRAETLPVVVLGSCRSGHQVKELHRVTDDLLRAGGARLSLGPLDERSIASLVTEVLHAEPPETLLERVQGASGNPLFVIEFVRSLEAADAVDEPSSGAALEFRLTVLRRLASWSDRTNDALRLASVLGSAFAPRDLAAVTRQPVAELTTALHEALVGSILEERGDHLAFRHALVRDAIYEHIPAAVRHQLHREVATALADNGSDALTVAHHLALGADTGDAEAVEWLRRAARDAAPRSPATAVDLLERARALLGPDTAGRDPLLAELALALACSGRLAEAEALSVEVLKRRPDPEIAGALRCGLVYALTWQGRPVEALKHADPAADEVLSERDAALLRAEAAVASLFAFDFKGAGARAAEAAAEAERLGHDLALCHALTVLSWVTLFAGHPHEGTDLGARAVEIADRSSTGEGHLAHPRFFSSQNLLNVDRLDEADEMLRSGLRLAEGLGLVWSLPLYHSRLGARGFIAGDWDGSVAECEAALAVADEVGLHVGAVAVTSAWLAVIQLHRDDLDGAEQTLATANRRLAAEPGPQLGMGVLNWAQARLLDAQGRRDEALALLQAAWDLYMAGGPMTDPWSAMEFVRMCVSSGDNQRAAALLPVMDEQAAAVATPFTLGQALRCRGLVERDADTLVRAVASYRQCPRPLELAAACEDAAMVLAASGRLEEGVPLWEEAVDLYERVGAERDLARIASQLRQHGVRRGTRRRHARATTGWESLTDTEHKVIALVAQRLSNPEVAERLFISRHTVESHLKHIYRKLGLSSRLELAAMALQRSQGEVE